MRVFKFIMAFAVIGALLTYSGCAPKSDPQPSAQDQQVTKLSKTWRCTGATLGTSPQTGYSSFQLTITGTAGATTLGFTASGRPTGTNSSPWPASGNFTFGTVDFATTLTRDDPGGALPVTYSVSENPAQLQMSFNYTGTGFSGRADVVTGNWVFTFVSP